MVTAPVPEPAEAAPGIWRIPLPFPNPLRYTLCYLVRVADGVIAVDLGWNSAECWTAFTDGLRLVGSGLDDLVGVLITHVHPDHYGLAGHVREQTSAWIAMHPAETPRIAGCHQERVDEIGRMADWLRQVGAPGTDFDHLRNEAEEIVSHISMTQPDRKLADGDPVPGTDETLLAVHTPGHTPGHLCFYDRERELLFTGDHILPRVTPNISKRPGSGEDPLADFLSSIGKIRLYRDALVLPGHEWTFDKIGNRLDALVSHHEERLTEIEQAVAGGASTVSEVAQAVTWARPFDSLQGRARRSAFGETHSHLHRLAVLGRLRWLPGTPDRWLPR